MILAKEEGRKEVHLIELKMQIVYKTISVITIAINKSPKGNKTEFNR